jgi:hypothetical protein
VAAPTLLLRELADLGAMFSEVRAASAAVCLPEDGAEVARLEQCPKVSAEKLALALGFFNSGWLPLLRRAASACGPRLVHALDGARWSLDSAAQASDALEGALLVVSVVVPPCRGAAAAVTEALAPRAGRLRVETLRLWPDAQGAGALQAELWHSLGRSAAPRVLEDRVPTRY